MIQPSPLDSVTLPVKPEGRQTPRNKVVGLAYITIGASNGGIVLNVSEGGLCFHAIAPVRQEGTVRFWFLEQNQRIEAEGELAWTDETRKIGGLRFTALPAEGRQQVRNWISEAATRLAADQGFAASAPLRAFAAPGAGRPDTKVRSGSPLAVVSTKVKVPRIGGFFGGLAIGLLVSLLVAAAFLFKAHRRELGESLIKWGQRLAAKPQALTQTPASGTVSPEPAQSPVLRHEKLPRQPLADGANSQQAKLKPAALPPTALTISGGRVPAGRAAAAAAAISPTPPTISLPTISVVPNTNLIPGTTVTAVPQLAPANHRDGHAEASRVENTGSNSGMYFEIGKFKDELGARNTTNELAQLGFHASIIQKGRLWTNSYYVLVGPYGDDEQAAAHKNLVSLGFNPRAFERGSRNFGVLGACDAIRRMLRSGLNTSHLPAGDCTIRWESYSAHAIVKFVQDNAVVATANGKWVKAGVTHEWDALVYRKNEDGSRTLLEIQFAGTSNTLVFGKSS